MTHVVIVNGWSAHASLWDDFVSLFPSNTRVDIIDLDKSLSQAEWMSEIDSVVQNDSVLMGWSLGGELAIAYTSVSDKSIKALCLFQTNPCFVKRRDWPFGMDQGQFEQFSTLVGSGDELQVRRQFAHMMVEGSDDHKADRRLLKRIYESETSKNPRALKDGIALLESINVWEALNNLELPVLNILGDRDTLVSVDYSHHYPASVVSGMGHLPCLSYKNVVFDLVQEFLNSNV